MAVRSLNAQSLGGEVCPALGRAVPGAQTSSRVQLAKWTRPMCGSRAFGSICIVRSTTPAPQDFLLTPKRDRKAALRFLRKAIRQNGTPEKITIDKSDANITRQMLGFKASRRRRSIR